MHKDNLVFCNVRVVIMNYSDYLLLRHCIRRNGNDQASKFDIFIVKLALLAVNVAIGLTIAFGVILFLILF